MEGGECGVCGSWLRGDLFPSGNKRQDGTTPHQNFVCARCQRDVRELRDIERALAFRLEEKTPPRVASMG